MSPRHLTPVHVDARRDGRHARLLRLGYASYEDYLRSSAWRRVRARYFNSDLPKACACGDAQVVLHHKTYERVGEEELTDLVPLCNACHSLIHSLEREQVIELHETNIGNPFLAAKYRAEQEEITTRARDEFHGAREGRKKNAFVELRSILDDLRRVCESIGINPTSELRVIERNFSKKLLKQAPRAVNPTNSLRKT